MEQTSNVVRFHRTGDASTLKFESLPLPVPGKGEVLIKVKCLGLNRAEVMFREGEYLEQPVFPSRLGYEASGVVQGVGSDVSNIQNGQQVSTIPAFSMGKYGVYGEHAVVPEHAVAPIPKGFTYEQGASIWMQYITAYGALLDIGKLKKGDDLLVTAASSSVGVAAIQIAKHLGVNVIATTRSDEKNNFLLDVGADHVVNTRVNDWQSEVLAITQDKGVDLVLDPIGGPLLADLAEACAQGGTIIEYGALDDRDTPYPLFQALAKGLNIRGYTLFELTQNPQKVLQAKTYLLSLFNDGYIEPVIDRVFNFSEIQEAHRYMESNQQKGKIIVTL